MAQNITIAGASFTDVPAIDVPKTGGGTARYIDPAEINAELLVSLDSDFVAGNIKKDVDLFGLIGTLEGGGVFATGTFTPSVFTALRNNPYTITHNLGHIPSYIFVWDIQNFEITDARTKGALYAILSSATKCLCFYQDANTTSYGRIASISQDFNWTGSPGDYGAPRACIGLVNATSFAVGSSVLSVGLDAVSYRWLAV